MITQEKLGKWSPNSSVKRIFLLKSVFIAIVEVVIVVLWCLFVLFVGCLTSQQHASVSQGRICTDNFTCCHTKLQIKLSTSPSHSILTPGRPVPALIL